jgi:hypothetical protein
VEYFLYSSDLPFSGIQLSYREINSKEQLILAKTNILFPMSEENSLDYARICKKVISNCVENKEEFYKLNLLDYILFLTKLRIISIGPELDLQMKSDEDSTENTIKISIDLNVFMKNLYQAATEAMSNNFIESNGIKIILNWPSIKSERSLLKKNDKTELEHILSTIPEYIKTIIINDNTIDLLDFNTEEKIEIYEKLPISLRTQVQMAVIECIKKLSEKNMFDIPMMEFLKFSFYNKTHQEIIRLLFSNDLRNIYQEYYVLASKKINPEYVDKLSIPERRVFCSFIEEEIKAREENNKTGDEMPISDGQTGLQDLIDEFEG